MTIVGGTLIGLGVALVLAGAAVVLQLLTAPIVGHVMGRSAYRSGAPLWEGTHTDDLRPSYEQHPSGR